MIFLYISVFLVSIFLLYWSGSRLVNSLIKICYFLGWREFVVAFFIMALGASVSNLFLDINAAAHKMPELAFGDIVGGNIADLSLVVGLIILSGNIILPVESKVVQTTALFTVAIAILPMLLIADGWLTRSDGLILIMSFVFYTVWLFRKKERFVKEYDNFEKKKNEALLTRIKKFLKALFSVFIFIAAVLIGSQGIISSIKYFSSYFNLGLSFLAVVVVGLGNCIPELYFSLVSLKKKQNWLILGNLMGSVIVCSTFVLGIVALIFPFSIQDFRPFFIARVFLILSALFFLLVLKTGRRITRLEGLFLLIFYIIFLATEIIFK